MVNCIFIVHCIVPVWLGCLCMNIICMWMALTLLRDPSYKHYFYNHELLNTLYFLFLVLLNTSLNGFLRLFYSLCLPGRSWKIHPIALPWPKSNLFSMQCKPFGRSRTFVLKVMWILVDGDQVETGSKDAIVSSWGSPSDIMKWGTPVGR